MSEASSAVTSMNSHLARKAGPWSKAGCADWTDFLIYENMISGPELRVLRALCRNTDQHSGQSFAGKLTIARFAGMDPAHAWRALQSLIEKGLVEILQHGSRGSGNSNLYQLKPDWDAVSTWQMMALGEMGYAARTRAKRAEKAAKKGDQVSPFTAEKEAHENLEKGDWKGDWKGDSESHDLVGSGRIWSKPEDKHSLRSCLYAASRGSAGAQPPFGDSLFDVPISTAPSRDVAAQAANYARFLASKSETRLPPGEPGIPIWDGRRVRAVTFGAVEISIPNHDWSPTMTACSS